ncbi:MAG TPA: CBS domain-containing protein [Steroidobacteraceae bacterium]|nr:CBS domain-containing protein [Steroidobacteraceae bacterium]
MSVGSICRREAVTIEPEASLADAARVMREQHVGMLVVVEPVAGGTDRRVQGVLTDRDIVTTVVGRDTQPGELKVVDIMTRNPLTVAEGQSVPAVLRHMRDLGVRRVPVVGSRNELVGVLSLDDVLDFVADQLSVLSGAIRGGQNRERVMRP